MRVSFQLAGRASSATACTRLAAGVGYRSHAPHAWAARGGSAQRSEDSDRRHGGHCVGCASARWRGRPLTRWWIGSLTRPTKSNATWKLFRGPHAAVHLHQLRQPPIKSRRLHYLITESTPLAIHTGITRANKIACEERAHEGLPRRGASRFTIVRPSADLRRDADHARHQQLDQIVTRPVDRIRRGKKGHCRAMGSSLW